VRLVVLKEISQDEGLRRHWNALVQAVDKPQVFYTWEWAYAVQRAYQATLRPLVFLAYDDEDSLCGIVALATNPEQTTVSFLCATTGDYCDFLSSSQVKPAFVAAVLAELQKLGVREVALTNLPADSSTLPTLRPSSRQHGYHIFVRTAYVCSQVVLARLERRSAGKNQTVLPRKKMLRRFLNAMGRQAPVRLDRARTWAEIEPAMSEFFQSHVARFLNHGLISNVAHPERQLFLRELARLLCEQDWMVFTRMMSGEKVFAWNFGFEFHNVWFWYQPTFDSALEKYSPGFCLLAKLIEEAADNPMVRVVDLGLGAEEYKERFSNQTRETLRVTLKVSARKHYREIVRHHVSSLVRGVPGAESALRGVRERLRDVGRRGPTHESAKKSTVMGSRIGDRIWSRREIVFYEWAGRPIKDADSCRLRAIDLNLLAAATIQYVDDATAAEFLIRAAARLRRGNVEGFALVDRDSAILHLVWASEFEQFFLAELKTTLSASPAEGVVLFDGWTPAVAQGTGYRFLAAALIGQHMLERGVRLWVPVPADDAVSCTALEQAGFERRHCIRWQRVLWWRRIKGNPVTPVQTSGAEVSAHV
jgi:CelD/BcsL family acetyltransferase involved in cellulose biosynthesis